MIDFYKNKKYLSWIAIFLIAVFLFGSYVPRSLNKAQTITYEVKMGEGGKEIARDLQNRGIIQSPLFFRFYTVFSASHFGLQAGKYELSPSMSVAEIVKKFVTGDIVKNKITIVEGWSLKDIAEHLESEKLYSNKDFLASANSDFSQDFSFLRDKPKNLGLEGYVFPDTYYLTEKSAPEDFLKITLSNFDKKLTPQLREEIIRQNKSIFKIITMASMLEKEVKSPEDKKIVSGILWKRIKEGIPLQVDATVNYITGKNDAKVSTKDSQIDSRYNTYKYYGLPLGPISNPGIDSILAAIYPEESSYWYYLSADGNGMTIFSETLDEHNIARAKYFK